jgi:hypothetical protein
VHSKECTHRLVLIKNFLAFAFIVVHFIIPVTAAATTTTGILPAFATSFSCFF